MIDRLAEALARGPIVLDAAMGTRLIALGLDLRGDDPSSWTLDRPEVVLGIHRLDIDAGSDALLTDTFGANRAWLDRLGRGADAAAINRQAVMLARVAAGPDRLVIGSIGPTALDDPDAIREQADALIEAGVDALVLETFRLDGAILAIGLLRGSPSPILASLFDWPEPIADAARALADAGAAAIGANCSPGMASALALARRLGGIVNLPILLKPADGTPEDYEAAVAELLALGVRLVGGCCGTTDRHVSALRRGIEAGR